MLFAHQVVVDSRLSIADDQESAANIAYLHHFLLAERNEILYEGTRRTIAINLTAQTVGPHRNQQKTAHRRATHRKKARATVVKYLFTASPYQSWKVADFLDTRVVDARPSVDPLAE